MDIQVVISQMAVLFILIAVGYIAGKIKMLTHDGVKVLSKVVLNISTPSTILNSVLSNTGDITGGGAMHFLAISLLAYVFFFLVAIPSSRAISAVEVLSSKDRIAEQEKGRRGNRIRSPEAGQVVSANGDGAGKPDSGLYTSMIVFGNVGFMGYPVINAIFGVEAMFYAAIVNIIFNALAYSVGIILISGKGRSVNMKLLLNATLIAAIISFVIVFTGFRAPNIVKDALSIASGVNTPCAMFVIGATLSRISVKDVFVKWQLYPVAIAKMIVIPLATWLVFRFFIADGTMLGVLTVLSGMPIAAAIAMLAIEYGGDERVASCGVFLTTLLSAVTIPLIVYIFLN